MQKEIRVLHSVAGPLTGSILVSPIALRQSELGYKVEFASSSGEHLDKLNALGFPVHIIPISRRFMAFSHITAIYRLYRLMRQQKYHVVHTHTPIASFLGRIAAKLSKTPIIIYHMRGSFWASHNIFTRTLFTIAEQIAGYCTSHIFTINCIDAEELINRRIVKPENVSCVHCGAGGLDTQRFNPARFTSTHKRKIKQELCLNNSDFVIGFIGRLVKEKGIFELLEALQKLVTDYPDIKLLIVGNTLSSERDQTSQKRISQLINSDKQLANRIFFTGFRDDIPELISIMDTVVLPSYREGFGMVLAEAASMEKPVITTNTRGGCEAVKDDETGFIIPIGNSESLKNAIMKLYINAELRIKMGRAGRLRALNYFDESVVFEKIKAIYEQLLKKNNFLLNFIVYQIN
jgi:glycosyltransferase involved in cell wall biosynthesis